jgi:uncharacterized protein (DUF4213/DUF364 family)
MRPKNKIPLGCVPYDVDEGSHICLIYTSEAERRESLLKYLLRGLVENECCAAFSAELREEEIREYLEDHSLDLDQEILKGALTLGTSKQILIKEGRFEPQNMLDTLVEFYKAAEAGGFKRIRAVGEMTPEVEKVADSKDVMRFESQITQLIRNFPMTALCQYNAQAFDGAMIMDVLKVHPQIIVNGAVVENPFFLKPEVVLGVEGG